VFTQPVTEMSTRSRKIIFSGKYIADFCQHLCSGPVVSCCRMNDELESTWKETDVA
jgi:hypothetical protein